MNGVVTVFGAGVWRMQQKTAKADADGETAGRDRVVIEVHGEGGAALLGALFGFCGGLGLGSVIEIGRV